MRRSAILVAWMLLFCNVLARAQSPAAAVSEDPEHEKLRAVRDGLIEAYNKRDLDKLLSYCHPTIVVTWQNAEVTTGREGLRSYYERMLVGPDAIVNELTADPKVDDISTIFGGDTATARGTMNDNFKLSDGSEFAMNSRWSATLVKENDRWLVAAFHASVNAFDNGILRMAVKRVLWISGGVALVIGLALGLLFGRMSKRRKSLEPRP